MGRFVEGEDRRQSLLLPESLDDYVTEDNPVRVVEVFIEELDLGAAGGATGEEAVPAVVSSVFHFGSNPPSAPGQVEFFSGCGVDITPFLRVGEISNFENARGA